VLIVFAIMLTAQLGEGNISQTNALAIPAALIAVLLGWGLEKMMHDYDWNKAASVAMPGLGQATDSNIMSIGKALASDYVLPFEMIGLLLFMALIGAVLIARKETAP
jgi:NADH:ubiquinone oxidoreductase subunit 6 (subunit J)